MSRSLFRFHSLRVKKVKLLCGFWSYNPHYTWWETTPEWKLFILCLIYKTEIFTYTLSYAYRYMMSTTFLLKNTFQTAICLKTDIENQIHSQLLSRVSCSDVSHTLWPPWTVARQVPPSMGFFRTRILEWVAISFSRGYSWPRDWTWVLPHCR